MKGYYKRNSYKDINTFFVPFNLIIYEKGNKINFIYDPNQLEDFTIKLTNGDFLEDFKSGLIETIDLNEDFLSEFRTCVHRKKYEEAESSLLTLFAAIKTIVR